MPDQGVLLGAPVGPFEGCLDVGSLRGFAEATRDPSAQVRAGAVVPPVALVTQVWEAQNTGRDALVPTAFQRAARGGVHGAHDLVLLRPIEPGESLKTWVEGYGARRRGPNAAVTLRYTTVDAAGIPVAEQLWTTIWLGVTCDDVGDAPPARTISDEAKGVPLGTWRVDVDGEMARRYAAVSGDWSRHHFDADAARRSGSDRPFLHGICTMALCAQGVSEVIAGGDPARVGRVALRFARPVPLGERLSVELYDAGPLGCAFEATAGASTVITHGHAALR
jgi:acyl dehydratase